MNFVFNDIEGTGLFNTDEVIQFSAIVADSRLRLLGCYDFHCYTSKDFGDSTKIHGKTPEMVYKLSGGKTFEEQFYNLPIANDKKICWVGYNYSFDKRIINQTLTKYNYEKHDFGKTIVRLSDARELSNFDVMQSYKNATGLYRGFKLVDAIEREIPGGMAMAKKMFIERFGDKYTGSSSAHDALFDSYLTYLLVCKTKEMHI